MEDNELRAQEEEKEQLRMKVLYKSDQHLHKNLTGTCNNISLLSVNSM